MPTLREKRLFLLDMDGTIYLDDRLFDGVIPFLHYIRQVGGRYLFLTNNSSRGVEGYMEKMRRLGIETEKSDYLTSVDVSIAALQKERPGKKCYVFGTRDLRECRRPPAFERSAPGRSRTGEYQHPGRAYP